MTPAREPTLPRPIRIDGDVAYVPLTKGHEAVINAADVHLVANTNWCVLIEAHTVYAVRTGPRPKQSSIRMHRVIMGEPVGLQVDHRDGDGLNNRRDNLRVATSSQNAQNQRRSSANLSGHKGVGFHKTSGKWRARIKLNGKRKHLGYFDTPEDAHEVYCKVSAELHGEFGRTK